MEEVGRGVPAYVYPISSGVVGGLFGGLAMIPFAIAYGLLSGNGIWYPVNLIAATVVRDWQVYSPTQLTAFTLSGLAMGLIIHLIVSTGLGTLYAILLPPLPGSPQFWALIVGTLLWFGATYAALPLLNHVMARQIDLPSFLLANIAYGIVLGLWVARTPKIPAG